MFTPAFLLRTLIPAVALAAIVVVVGLLPLFRAATSDADDVLYTTDLAAGQVDYAVVRPGASICAAGVELAAGARRVRLFVRADRRTRLRLVTRFEDDRGVAGTARIDETSDPSPGVPYVVPVEEARATGSSRVCTVNRGRRTAYVGSGQSASVGFSAAPARPQLRIDVLANGHVDRLGRVGDALSAATLFKSRVVSSALFFVGAVLILGAVAALVVAILRSRDEDAAPR